MGGSKCYLQLLLSLALIEGQVFTTILKNPAIENLEEQTLNNHLLKKRQIDVQGLINGRVDMEVSDENGFTPLLQAAAHGHTSVVKLLLSKGANLKARDRLQRTPLDLAILNQHIETVETLIAVGADVNAKDNIGNSPLKLALRIGSPEVVKLLTSHGLDLNAKDNKGITALHWAVVSRNTRAVEILLDAGAKTEVTDGNKLRPLALASKTGYADIVSLLLSYGADLNADNGLALHWAAALGHVDVVMLLIYAGANMETLSDVLVLGRMTPLCAAVMTDHTEVMEVLLNGRASMRVCNRDNGYTALHYAAAYGNLNAVNLLWRYGADRSAKDKGNQTPWDRAKLWGFNHLLESLKP